MARALMSMIGVRARRLSRSLRVALVLSVVMSTLSLGAPTKRLPRRAVHAATTGSVTELFSRAKAAFAAGDYARAQRLLAYIIKKYPGHKPSVALMGRVQYRVGNVRRAAYYFDRAGSDSLDDSNALEWGLAFYTIKDCRRALPALERAGGTAQERGIAKFYAATCYMRSGDLDRADRAIAKARPLPAELSASRRKIVMDLRKRRLAQARGQMPRYVPYIMPPPPMAVGPVYGYGGGPLAPPMKEAEAAKAAAAAAPEAPEAPKVGLSFSASPSVSIYQRDVKYEYGGYKIKNSSERRMDESLGLQARYDGRPRVGGGQPSFTLDLTGSGWQKWSKGDMVEYQVFEESGDEIVAKESTTPETFSQEVDVEFRPAASLPMTPDLSLDLSFSYANYYEDGNTKLMSGDRVATAAASGDVSSVTLNASVTQSTSVDKQETPTAKYMELGGGASYDGDAFSIAASGTWTQNQPVLPAPEPLGTWDTVSAANVQLDKSLDLLTTTLTGGMTARAMPANEFVTEEAPNEQFGELSLGLPLPIGVKLGATGRYTIKSGALWELESDDENAPASATKYATYDVTEMKGVFTGKMSPLDWLTLKGEFIVTQSTISVSTPTIEQAVALSVADRMQRWTVTMAISKSF